MNKKEVIKRLKTLSTTFPTASIVLDFKKSNNPIINKLNK